MFRIAAPRQAARAASVAFAQSQAVPAAGASAAQSLTARWMSAAAPGPKVRPLNGSWM